MAKQQFTVVITTDGLDNPSDMEGIATALRNAVSTIVMPFVYETMPALVKWDGCLVKGKARKPRKRRTPP